MFMGVPAYKHVFKNAFILTFIIPHTNDVPLGHN